MNISAEIQRLYDLHGEDLFAFAYRLTGNETDANDVLQELYLKIAHQPELLAGAKDEKTYLFTLLHHIAVNELNARNLHREREQFLANMDSPEPIQPQCDHDSFYLREKVARAFASLSLDQRTILSMYVWEDFTFEEIAQMCNVSLGTVHNRYYKALEQLRPLLEPLQKELQ